MNNDVAQVRTVLSGDDFQTLAPAKAGGLSATDLPDGRWVLYDRGRGLGITLTAPAGILWELCDGQTLLTGLIAQLNECYPDVPVSQMEVETSRMLGDFLEQGLIVHSTPNPA